MICIHTEIRPAGGDRVSLRVVYQSPAVIRRLPFSSGGCTVASVGSGRPFIGFVGGVLTVGLRGPGCGDAYRNEPVTAVFPGRVPEVLQAARRIVSELRVACRGDAAGTRTGDPAVGGC